MPTAAQACPVDHTVLLLFFFQSNNVPIVCRAVNACRVQSCLIVSCSIRLTHGLNVAAIMRMRFVEPVIHPHAAGSVYVLPYTRLAGPVAICGRALLSACNCMYAWLSCSPVYVRTIYTPNTIFSCLELAEASAHVWFEHT